MYQRLYTGKVSRGVAVGSLSQWICSGTGVGSGVLPGVGIGTGVVPGRGVPVGFGFCVGLGVGVGRGVGVGVTKGYAYRRSEGVATTGISS